MFAAPPARPFGRLRFGVLVPVLALAGATSSSPGAVSPPAPNPLGPAVVVVTDRVIRPANQIVPLGASGFGDIPGLSYASNNLFANSGIEPVSLRRFFRVVSADQDGVLVDRGGPVLAAQFAAGDFAGARVRIYRFEPWSGGRANQFVHLADRKVAPGAGATDQDDHFTVPEGLDLIRFGERCTDGADADHGGPENGLTYTYAITAVDARGRESEPSPVALSRPNAGVQAGPHFVLASGEMPRAVGGEDYNGGGGFVPPVTGGQAPLKWKLLGPAGELAELPRGMVFDPATGQISGRPTADVSPLFLRFEVTDAQGQSDFRTVVLNPPPDEPFADGGLPLQPPANLRAVPGNGAVTLSWPASVSPGVVGYRVYRARGTAVPQPRIRLEGGEDGVQPGDFLFLDLLTDAVSLPDSTGSHGAQSPAAAPFPEHEGWSVTSGSSLAIVPHPWSPRPPFPDAGETCLRVTAGPGPGALTQGGFTSADGPGAAWYGQLEPGRQYRLEVWLRQRGLGSGAVDFSFSGGAATYPTVSRSFAVGEAWKRCVYDFVAPPRPASGGAFGPRFGFTGPGELWVDNARLFRFDNAADIAKTYVPNRTLLGALFAAQPASGAKGSLRLPDTLLNQGSLDALLSYHPDSAPAPDAAGPLGTVTSMPLPMALEFALHTGSSPADRMAPVIPVSLNFDEAEWAHLIEYLGVPFDPRRDTPRSKPYAYRRFLQRGTGVPWSAEFASITLEVGSKTWIPGTGESAGGFGPDSGESLDEAGRIYGAFAAHCIESGIWANPEWSSLGLASRIKFALGGPDDARVSRDGRITGYAESALGACSEATVVDQSTAVWPRFPAGDLAARGTGAQRALESYWVDLRPRFAKEAEAARAPGPGARPLELESGGSGPTIPWDSAGGLDQTNADAIASSPALAVSAFEAWLDAVRLGWSHQEFGNFGQGEGSASHTPLASNFEPAPAWLALSLRNRTLRGDMLDVEVPAVPAYRRKGPRSRDDRIVPLLGAYAFRDGGTYMVVLVSRKLAGRHDGTDFGDGCTSVAVQLPFAQTSAITYSALRFDGLGADGSDKPALVSGTAPVSCFDPGSHTFLVGEASGARPEGLPPGSIYVYIFSGCS